MWILHLWVLLWPHKLLKLCCATVWVIVCITDSTPSLVTWRVSWWCPRCEHVSSGIEDQHDSCTSSRTSDKRMVSLQYEYEDDLSDGATECTDCRRWHTQTVFLQCVCGCEPPDSPCMQMICRTWHRHVVGHHCGYDGAATASLWTGNRHHTRR